MFHVRRSLFGSLVGRVVGSWCIGGQGVGFYSGRERERCV